MGKISEKLNIINDAKNNIKNAIEEKGISVGDAGIQDYASKIIEIQTGGGTGGGATINGKLEQKTIASGSIVKGDLVVATEQSKKVILTSDSYFISNASSIIDLENMFDESSDTYAKITSTKTSTKYFKFKLPSANTLGISENTLILGYALNVDFKEISNSTTSGYTIYGRRYSEFDVTARTTTQKYFTGTSSLNKEVGVRKTLSCKIDHMFYAKDSEEFGGDFGWYSSEMHIYNIEVTLTYLDNGVVKTVTTTCDQLIGIANSNGVEGNTIDVYVPNVEEEKGE